MAMTITNKTFGIITPANADWTTAVNIVTVAASTNLHINTVKVVDFGGDGGEIRFILSDGTTTYYFDIPTIAPNACLDLSPLRPYDIEAGWSIKYQSKGGAGIHITLTGVLQAVSE